MDVPERLPLASDAARIVTISAVVVAALAACGPVVEPSGQGHDATSDSASDTQDDGNDSSPPATSASSVDSSGPIDMGPGTMLPVDHCPLAGAEGIAIDSQVRVELENTATPEIVASDPIALTCGGQPVDGEVLLGPGQIVFAPSAALLANTTCEVSLAADAVTVDGAVLDAVTWSFTTGTTTGVEFDFDEPRQLSDGHALNPQERDAEGDDVVLQWDVPMTIARSTDRGETFEVTVLDTVDGFVQMPDLHLQDGVVHVTWQVLDGNNIGQCYYSRSEPGLGAMSEPLHLVALPNTMLATWPSVTTDGGDRVVVTWVVECPFDVMCDEDAPGLYSIESNDGGASFGPPTRVLGWDAWGYAALLGPRLGWIDGGVGGVWERFPNGVSTGVELLDGEAGFPVVSWIDDFPGGPRLTRTTQGQAVVFTFEATPAGTSLQLSRLRSRTLEGFDPPLLLAEQQDTDQFFATADAHGEDLVAVTTSAADFDAPATIELRMSVDGGFTFTAAQSLDFLPHDSPSFVDNAFPLVTLADEDRVHLYWHLYQGDSYAVQYTHGDRIAPCGLKSGV